MKAPIIIRSYAAALTGSFPEPHSKPDSSGKPSQRHAAGARLFGDLHRLFFGAVLTAPRPVSFNPRFQFCQEPLRGFAKRLKLLSCVLRHGQNHDGRIVGNVQFEVGKIRNV